MNNHFDKDVIETNSEGIPRRPLEERKLNMKIWFGFVIALAVYFLLLIACAGSW